MNEKPLKTWPTHPLFKNFPGQYVGIPEEVAKQFHDIAKKILIGSLYGKFRK